MGKNEKGQCSQGGNIGLKIHQIAGPDHGTGLDRQVQVLEPVGTLLVDVAVLQVEFGRQGLTDVTVEDRLARHVGVV